VCVACKVAFRRVQNSSVMGEIAYMFRSMSAVTDVPLRLVVRSLLWRHFIDVPTKMMCNIFICLNLITMTMERHF
jgi:hypothetical protein